MAFAESLFSDGRSSSLEEQAWQPILAEDEMGNLSVSEVLDRISADNKYQNIHYQLKQLYAIFYELRHIMYLHNFHISFDY